MRAEVAGRRREIGAPDLVSVWTIQPISWWEAIQERGVLTGDGRRVMHFFRPACSLALGRFLRAHLYGIGPGDPATLAVAAVVLLLSTAVAALLPAWRASHTDPMATLRDN